MTVNHGIVRLWIRDPAPFWKQHGFIAADAETLKRLPASWAQQTSGWFTLKLKDEESILSLEKELALFMESEKQRTARAFQQARMLRTFATLLAVVFAIFVVIAVVFILRKNASLPAGR